MNSESCAGPTQKRPASLLNSASTLSPGVVRVSFTSMSTLLVGHLYNCWQFNNDLHGLNGQPFGITSPVYSTGKFGNGLRMSVGAPVGSAMGTQTMQTGGNDWTGMFWLRLNSLPPAPSGEAAILDNRNSSNGFGISMQSDGVLFFRITGADFISMDVQSPTPLVANTDYLILFGYNTITKKTFLRINDVQAVLASTIVASPGVPKNLTIGAGNISQSSSFDGVVSLLTFWRGRALTVTEMQALWNGGAGLDYPF